MKAKHLFISALAISFGSTLVAATAGARAESITTTDGRTYPSASVLRSDPDGVIIQFVPTGGGMGMAKINFRVLPEEFRSQFNYSAEDATAYERQSAEANEQWRTTLAQEESATRRYRNLAELNRSLAGDDAASFSVSLAPNGALSAHGFTGSRDHYSPWWNYAGLQQPYGSLFGLPAGNVQRARLAEEPR